MRVRFLTGVGGNGFAYQRGSEVEVPEEQAKNWIDAGQAELVRQKATEDTSRRRRGEKATTR